MSTDNAHAHYENQLRLIQSLDHARDSLTAEDDPLSMFGVMANDIKGAVHADACAILVMAEDGEAVEHTAAVGIKRHDAERLGLLALENGALDDIETVDWQHAIGMPVRQAGYAHTFGVVIVMRNVQAFDEDDMVLLQAAEGQIDSAVLQARRMLKLAQHNRELEAIYRIDRLRDAEADDVTLINGFLSVLGDYFRPDLIMIILTRVEDGEQVLRGMVDRTDLSADALKAIRALAAGVSGIRVIQSPPEIAHLKLASAPLIVSNKRLGTLVIGRTKDYSPADFHLLDAMVTQIDSAVAHSRVIQQLVERNLELETIYRIDQIRDSDTDLDNMLQQVLTELCTVVESDMGYLMLFSEDSERKLEIRATTGGDLFSEDYYATIHAMSRDALEAGQPMFSNETKGSVRSIVAIPLILNDQVIGVFGAVNRSRADGFSAQDRRILQAITSQVDTAVFERLERRRIRRLLSRSVDPKVLDQMMKRTHEEILAGERVVITALFADLRGSTEWTERTAPEELVSRLNRFLGGMTDVIFRYGGTLDKFVGDEVIALFGTPVEMADHALVAVRCAMEMQAIHKQLIVEAEEIGSELPEMGIGVSTGEVIAGEMGPPVRTDFTAMGRVMNLGARLCSAAPGGDVFISKQTYDAIASNVEAESLAEVNLKGLGAVDAYKLIRIMD